MEKIVSRLTVFFEAPFWVGVCERNSSSGYAVCKVTFGTEPKDFQVYQKVVCQNNRLQYSAVLPAENFAEKRQNPKRMQREAAGQLQQHGVGTKAQQALKLQQQQGKEARKEKTRAQKEAEKQRRFSLHRQKQLKKHKGH
ncbi:MAG: YjdF family protein [Oscillospiraceae bacterium]|nr:YjdF family protein [Oscillospiraceae bacterium]MDD3261796.1 YjdF family protein [Oscillospiraceae bacterium]